VHDTPEIDDGSNRSVGPGEGRVVVANTRGVLKARDLSPGEEFRKAVSGVAFDCDSIDI
jgi:hypothetical protein